MCYPSPTRVRRAGRVAPSGLRSLRARGLGWRVGCSHRGPGRLLPSRLSSALILSRPCSSPLPLLQTQRVSPRFSFPALHSTVLCYHTAQPAASLPEPPSQEQGSLSAPGDMDLGAAAADSLANWGATVGPSSSGLEPASLGEHPVLPQRGEKIPSP